ncbi:unnamed protein product, partial [marine sediment metagenome]
MTIKKSIGWTQMTLNPIKGMCKGGCWYCYYSGKRQWEYIAPVKIGGVAIDGEPTNGFKAGKYLRKGVVITSRGCPFNCPWCLVGQDLIELDDFPEGNIIQDNNFLACSRSHKDKVFRMLSHQKRIEFSGGLDSTL